MPWTPAQMGVMIPIIALMIPIIAILLAHQQKMARITHEVGGRNTTDADVERLKREVEALKEIVHTQALQLDDKVILKRLETEEPPPVPNHLQGGR